MNNLEQFYGPNAGYVLELYERFRRDPASVDAASRALFSSWPSTTEQQEESVSIAPVAPSVQTVQAEGSTQFSSQQVAHIVAASALARAIRERGHRGAHLDPLGSEPIGDPALRSETYGVNDEDLAHLSPSIVGGHAAEGAANALQAINTLRAMYSGPISYEFDQVKSPDERRWLRDAVGLRLYHRKPGADTAHKLLQRLTQVEVFERYLHQSFVGQKRFSIEGIDMLVPMLDEIITGAIDSETREIVVGMAHRGRLNVLAHVLEKPYAAILAEFAHAKHEEGVPLTDSFGYGWTGDVKYHLGAEYLVGESAHIDLNIRLAPNPSHLEVVNPVIGGMARASQEDRAQAGVPTQDVDKTLPILIHGDAAFSGEGVVAETLNLWHLRGYWVGGTIHIIANNQLGFTTSPQDGRSTPFASDLAKGFSLPIIHVNADDPYACLTAVRIAHAYRDHFHKDVVIDLVGYRRWGHNEGDEPTFTQPKMYALINNHSTVRALYAHNLEQEGVIQSGEADTLVKEAFAALEQAKQEAGSIQGQENEYGHKQKGEQPALRQPVQVSAERLQELNTALLDWPQGFTPNSKLARVLQRRATTLGADGGIDWGQAEALAFASLLTEGTPIRLTGQDTERGTFSHRNAVLHDIESDEVYIPLQHVPAAQAAFSIYNSSLSEVGALGFEYGYSVRAPEALVLWEAQFGDFSNMAQVIIDQFISSGRAKWKQDAGLVLLLPHGYEGQGPDHSSARLERYLQLAAQDNWRIANCTTSAQYYHLLRLQAANLASYPRPLIILTPKALLRNALSASRLQDLAQGTFQSVLDDEKARQHPEAVRRIVLCTGKIAIDLFAHESYAHAEDLAVVRVEMLYPFPEEELAQVLAHYPRVREIVWLQEEPKNMGAWSYMQSRLTAMVNHDATIDVISRPERSSPATGFWDLYVAEQERLIKAACTLPLKQPGGNYVH